MASAPPRGGRFKTAEAQALRKEQRKRYQFEATNSDDELEVDDAKDPEHEQMVARLENILKRSIADILPQTNSEDEAGERRRKKKRKVDSARQDVADGGDPEQVAVRTYCISCLCLYSSI